MPTSSSWLLRAMLVLGTVSGLLTCSASASAGIRPSFNEDHCTWNATHILVVTEGDKIDGDVEVLESWKGDMKKGDRITIPELAVFAAEKERAVNYMFIEKTPGLAARVTCSRMVLFLTKREKKAAGGQRGQVVWEPAAEWGGVKVSTAWVEAGRVYAFAQQINPGPSELISWGITERELHTGVEGVLQTRAVLSKALAGPDADKSAEAVLQLLRRTESDYVRSLALDAVVEAGEVGLPALRRVLGEAALEGQHGDAVWAMRKLPADLAATELTRVVTEELAYWRKVGPGLKKGWWDEVGMKAEEKERLRNRYSRAHSALQVLGNLRTEGCRDEVTAFRDWWKSLPQLGGELTQMTHACDSVLEALRK